MDYYNWQYTAVQTHTVTECIIAIYSATEAWGEMQCYQISNVSNKAQAPPSNKYECACPILSSLLHFSHLNVDKFKKAAGRSVISHQYVHAVIPLIFVSGSSVCIAAVPFTFYLWRCRFGKTGNQSKLNLLWLWLQKQKQKQKQP